MQNPLKLLTSRFSRRGKTTTSRKLITNSAQLKSIKCEPILSVCVLIVLSKEKKKEKKRNEEEEETRIVDCRIHTRHTSLITLDTW